MTAILNFSEYTIHLMSGEAILFNEQYQLQAYNNFVASRSNQTDSLSESDFRQWGKLTNLERGFLPLFIVSNSFATHMQQMLKKDMYDTELYTIILDQFTLKSYIIFPIPLKWE